MADQSVVVLRRNRPGSKAEVCAAAGLAGREAVTGLRGLASHLVL